MMTIIRILLFARSTSKQSCRRSTQTLGKYQLSKNFNMFVWQVGIPCRHQRCLVALLSRKGFRPTWLDNYFLLNPDMTDMGSDQPSASLAADGSPPWRDRP
jgi:hypothetical protein